MGGKRYVLITPARNEEAYIEETIKSVISQSIQPIKWIIVSDNSIDGTDEIVNKYATKYTFIELLRFGGDSRRNFGSKVKAFNTAHKHLRDIEYEFLGNLDADVSFGPRYYQNVLAKFHHNRKLGIAGGVCLNLHKGKFYRLLFSRNSVGGPIQLFRRQCYEEIGGYVPLERGGVDTLAEIMARMRGWEVESFPELEIYHFRPSGTASGSFLQATFRQGINDYLFGYHPAFEIARCLYRIQQRPFIGSSLVCLLGFCWAYLRRCRGQIPNDLISYLRDEQMCRLRSILCNERKAKMKEGNV